MKARVIALYLPQFHPTPNNNKWWGEGFTEWTNVGKAKKLFPGHYQPKIPADLGYYDLRLPETRNAQAEMAQKYGIDGFCYYHYWFDTNRQELELPFDQVLKSGEPDFPFMLCWANDTWSSKMWRTDGTITKKTLVEQKYGDKKDWQAHFYHLLPAFKDARYMKYENKPMFMVYNPLQFEKVDEFITLWQKLARENGLEGIHFIAQTFWVDKQADKMFAQKFDAINACRINDPFHNRTFLIKAINTFWRKIVPMPLVYNYKSIYKRLVGRKECQPNVYPTIIPNWDHTPRSGNGGYVWINATPKIFAKHVKDVLEHIKDKPESDQIIFLKSWNEWGEGNYMEPDLKYGLGYLEELQRSLKKS